MFCYHTVFLKKNDNQQYDHADKPRQSLFFDPDQVKLSAGKQGPNSASVGPQSLQQAFGVAPETLYIRIRKQGCRLDLKAPSQGKYWWKYSRLLAPRRP